LPLTEPKKKALVIAVSNYDNLSPQAQLPFCKNDGEQMVRVLEKLGFELKKKDGLVGKVEGIIMRDAINEFFEDPTIKSTDTMLFYYTGHGLPRGGQHYFSSSDIDSRMPGRRGLLFSELTSLIDRCQAKCVVAILDCCYAGAAGIVMADAQSQLENIKKNQQNDFRSQNEGRCLLAACDDNEQASPHAKQDYSFFTYYLLEALEGAGGASVNKEGKLTPQSILSYVNSAIDSLPENEKPLQRPFMKNIGRDEIELAYFDDWNRTKPQPTIEEQLISLLREGKIADYQTLKNQNPERVLDLDGFVFLENVDLRRIDLRWASLVDVDFSNRDLKGALFEYANLTNANLMRTNLKGANFVHCILNGAKLAEANMEEADLRAADLTTADCTATIFTKCRDFSRAILDHTTILQHANFNGTSLDHTTFHGKMNEVKFIGSKLGDITFDGADLTGADFTGTEGTGVKFIDCVLTKTIFKNIRIEWMDFAGGGIHRNVNISGAYLIGPTFNNMNLADADFSNAQIYKSSFVNTILVRPNFNGAFVDGMFRYVKWHKPILNKTRGFPRRYIQELDEDPFENMP
jgi:uncharacterized protein YjbI with pentapeptide repeats